jgi:ABC-type phosphate transport system permease subunit
MYSRGNKGINMIETLCSMARPIIALAILFIWVLAMSLDDKVNFAVVCALLAATVMFVPVSAITSRNAMHKKPKTTHRNILDKIEKSM